MKREEITETVTTVVGRKWTGYGHFGTIQTIDEVFNWLNRTEQSLAVLDDTPNRSKFNNFEVTLTIKKLS